MKFRKKSVVVEAVQYTGESRPVLDFLTSRELRKVSFHNAVGKRSILLSTINGTETVRPTDWIVRGVRGELFAYTNDLFVETYELVEEQ
jgi:hypothetical protein